MRDIGSGSVLVVVAFAYFLGAWRLPSGPSFFPFLLAGALFVLGTMIAVSGFRERQRLSGERRPWPLGIVAITTLYAFAFTGVGFVASTLVYTAALVLLLGRRGIGAVVIPIATTALIYAAFALGLGVPLP